MGGGISGRPLLSALFLGATAGCGTAGGGLKGAWNVVSIGAAPVSGPTFTLEGDKVSGFGGCNRFGGSVKVEGDTLRLGPLAATRMACDQLAVEQSYFDALESVRGYSIDGDKLVLTSESGAALVTLKR
jgi:heat shock protein HslJ